MQSHFLLNGNCPRSPRSHVLSPHLTAEDRGSAPASHLPLSLEGMPPPHTWYCKTVLSPRELSVRIYSSGFCLHHPSILLIYKAMNSVEKHPSASRAIEYAQYQLGSNLSSLIIHTSPEIGALAVNGKSFSLHAPGFQWF